MKFDELTAMWNGADAAVDHRVEANRKLIKEIGIRKIKSSIYDIGLGSIIEVAMEIYFLSFLWRFMGAHAAEVEFLIPALILFVVNLFGVGFEVYRFVVYLGLSAALPVASAQRKLSTLRRLEIFDRNSLLVIIPLFSGPILIVLAKAFTGFSLYTFGFVWLLTYTMGSMVVAVIIVLALKKFPNKKLSESISFLDQLGEQE